MNGSNPARPRIELLQEREVENMTDDKLKDLKARLWKTADQLRSGSGLKPTKYSPPILGLIFLRFANSKYAQFEKAINEEFNNKKGTRAEQPVEKIAIRQCGFYLPDCARYDKILNTSDQEDLAAVIKEAMTEMEKFNPELEGVLPKDVYYDIASSEDPLLLKKVVRNFKDIPDDVEIDIFGEIYEYFLGEFALAEGQGGGTFFTPSSVVRYMVEVLAPTEGKILDPACGSGGMFVQAARYMHRHNDAGKEINLRASGVEKEPDTVNLAKMNLILNNIRGEITNANSFYSDPYNEYGNFDYVMANPPFNVDEVSFDAVKGQPRFNEYGIPQNKSKKNKKDGDKTETVPNANYLWINLFATSLSERGRAALVMANSASDAGNSEYDIRKRLIEAGIIKQMVTLPSNMFNTVTLPATLWFFDKAKARTERKGEILFVDARNIFTQIDRAHRKFSDEQIKNLGVITRLYEGDTETLPALLKEYADEITETEKKAKFEIVLAQSVLKNQLAKLKEAKGTAAERQYARAQLAGESAIAEIRKKADERKAYFQSQIDWLNERFPDNQYHDIIGLCKVAKLEGEDGIKDQDYSLNPGRYVGVVIEDDGMTEEEFKAEMRSLADELTSLNTEAHKLEETIAANLKELGI